MLQAGKSAIMRVITYRALHSNCAVCLCRWEAKPLLLSLPCRPSTASCEACCELLLLQAVGGRLVMASAHYFTPVHCWLIACINYTVLANR